MLWIIYGSRRGTASLLAGGNTMLVSFYSLVGRWSRNILQFWPLLVLLFLIPWRNYTLGLNWKKASPPPGHIPRLARLSNTGWVYNAATSPSRNCNIPSAAFWVVALSVCREYWWTSIMCPRKKVLSFKSVVYWLGTTSLGGSGKPQKWREHVEMGPKTFRM